jgi:hypothetical protein
MCLRYYLAALARVLGILPDPSANARTFYHRTLTMRIPTNLISLVALFAVTDVTEVTDTATEPVRANPIYDNYGTSLNIVACSNGANGLVTKGYDTFGSLPGFPYIGGAYAVTGWNSTECGSCWKLTYPTTGVSVYYTAIDTINAGFDVSDQTMSKLTKGKHPDEIDVQSSQVAKHFCGL